MKQRTIAMPVTWTGIGVHLGRNVTMTAMPATVDQGVLFVRTDLLNGAREFPVRHDRVVSTDHSTTLGNGSGATLSTVEHFMAALAFTGIDNLTVEIDGAEVPLMDGSSLEFVRSIEAAGVHEQEAPRSYIRVLKEVEVRRRGGWARLAPLDGRSVSCAIDFPDPAIGYQEAAITLDGNSARSPVVSARTFATMDDIRQLRERGLARLEADDVGDLECVVVVDGDRILNRSGLRSATECAEHKVLDAVGDMALAPAPILGAFEGYRSGHALNVKLLTALFADRAAWERTLDC